MTFYSIQALRFIAAFLVLLFHLGIISTGYKGVDVFFVISGFVMYYTLFAKKKPVYDRFIVNRLTKIFFLYWVSLLFVCLVDPASYSRLNLRTIFLIPGHLSILGVSWSLSVELYFYFSIGIVAYLIPPGFHKALFCFFLAATFIVTLVSQFTPKLHNTPIIYLIGPNSWEFLLGILCAYISTRFYGKISYGPAVAVSAFCVILILLVTVPYMNPLSYLVYGSLSAGAVLFITAAEKIKKIARIPASVFQTLGNSSYCIYLLAPVVTLLINPHTASAKILTIIFSITFAVLFNRFAEDRSLSAIRRALYRITASIRLKAA